MEIALSPLEFARRTRKLYADSAAVVDEDTKLNYESFFERCDRWSAALQRLGICRGDRVAYVAPNTHAQLESFYAVPQIGGVLVPLNDRLTADDFAYLLNHSEARVLCADRDPIAAFERVRPQLRTVEQFVALNGSRPGWLDYEEILNSSPANFVTPDIKETDLLTVNYTSGTSGKPKGVMITHRNAYMNVIGTLLHFPLSAVDRYLWTLPMFHANGWTFVWTVTAVGATIERMEGEFGWILTHIYGLTETAPFITVCELRPEHCLLSSQERAKIKARQGVELLTSGELRVVDARGRETPRDGKTVGEII